MTDQQHPITPPPELVQQIADGPGTWLEKMSKAYCAGADQELKSCCEIADDAFQGCALSAEMLQSGASLRAARRPKPSSLAEQKQAILAEIHQLLAQISANNAGALAVAEPIRRALERLQELEGQGDD